MKTKKDTTVGDTEEKITFNEHGSKLLAEELIKDITKKGFNTQSKTDFYDFVLHLLNKYSNEKFLDNYSNYDNAQLLKTKPEKIKSSKLNIYLKYYEDSEKEEVLKRFIDHIISGEISMRDYDHNNKLQLTIEDPAVYFCLEGKMKEALKTGHDTSFNRELFKIDKKDFFVLLQSIAKELLAENYEVLKKKITKEKIEDNVGTVVNILMDTGKKVIGDNLSDVLSSHIKDGIGKLFHAIWGEKT